MQNIKLVVVFALFLSTTIFAQNLWKSEVLLNFTVQSNTKVSSFVDNNGIHIVYSRNGGIRYALVNSQGGVIKSEKVIETEGSGADFANVVAIENNVYAVYHKSNQIKVARSTNLGDNWSTTFSYWPMVNTACNKIVAYRDGSSIQITWSERRAGSSNDNDVHYIKFSPIVPQWTDYKNVSENESYGGENPDIAFNTEKVEVNYTTFQQPKNRERLSNTSWNTSESVPYYQYPVSQVKRIKPLIVGTMLNTIYSCQWSGMTAGGDYISHSYRGINQTTWTQNSAMLETDRLGNGEIYPHVTSNTADGKIHLVYWDKPNNRYSYRQLNGTTFGSHIAQIDIASQSSSLNSNSNDLYLLHITNPSYPSKIQFRQYDAVPLAPQNLSVTKSANNHPLLSWTRNNEADIAYYKIYKYVYSELGWQPYGTSTTTSFEDVNERFLTGGSYANEHWVYYKVTAVDKYPYESAFSNQVGAKVEGAPLEKFNSGTTPAEYSLEQNYPNPFNPSTKITYSIKEEGLVTLKVYDILGKEVVTLVNENKPAGFYEAEFNASALPSGMYIYKLQSGSFTDVKKMILTK